MNTWPGRYLGAFLILTVSGVTACQSKPPEAAATEPEPEVSVTVAPIVSATLHAYVTGWGTVEPEPATEGRPAASARIAAPGSGLITAVLISEGQRVTQGTTLFRLDSRVADVAVEHARQGVRFAEQLVQRQEQLGPGEATSQKAYQEARAQLTTAQSELNTAEAQRRLLDVKAPLDGTVIKVNARPGDSVDPSTLLAEVVDLSRLVVSASIRSVDAAQVKRGQRVELSPGSGPGPGAPAAAPVAPVVTSTIAYIAPQVDTATDTVIVRARVPPAAPLRPGQFVNIRVVTDERSDRPAVPVESVVQGAGGSEVAVVQGDTAIRTPVKTGIREGALIEVQGEGLRPGISVVVQGAYGLPAKSKIKILGH
jgi:membrane fusion protein (multidrug efflux system)